MAILSSHTEELRKLGVTSVTLFGSTARDEARSDSDVDVLIEVDRANRPFGFFALFRVKAYLEEILGRSVDVGERDAIRPEIRQRVEREAIRVP